MYNVMHSVMQCNLLYYNAMYACMYVCVCLRLTCFCGHYCSFPMLVSHRQGWNSILEGLSMPVQAPPTNGTPLTPHECHPQMINFGSPVDHHFQRDESSYTRGHKEAVSKKNHNAVQQCSAYHPHRFHPFQSFPCFGTQFTPKLPSFAASLTKRPAGVTQLDGFAK